jgi:uncharacterized protein YdhG (YjbR/CyaY superfamily)
VEFGQKKTLVFLFLSGKKPSLPDMDTKETFSNIDEYIAGFPSEVQVLLQQMRNVISENAPGVTEAIRYAMPTFVLEGNLVHFAGYKNHIGFYPAPSGIKEIGPEIEKYTWAKGSVQFPLDKEIPFDLVKRIIRFRVEENMRLAEEKRLKKRKN